MIKEHKTIKKAKARFLLSLIILICVALACICTLSACDNNSNQEPGKSTTGSNWIADIYKDYFPVGAAVTPARLNRYGGLLPHFNSVTAENDMKWRVLEPQKGVYSYSNADTIVNWARENDTAVRGHCLLWYKSLPVWLKDEVATKTQALNAIDKHIRKTVAYFGDSIYAWDVCNEALKNTVTAADVTNGTFFRSGGSEFNDSGTVDWYALCGSDYIKQTFRSADAARKELGLSNTELYYNDYGLNNPNKRAACVELVKMLLKDGIAIDGVGMQGHYRLPAYTADKKSFLQNFEDSIKAFTQLGVDVQITELDICIYSSSSDLPRFDSLPFDEEAEQGELYGKIFEICRKYATPWGNGYGKVTGITAWGVADDSNPHSNTNHKEYPLIFSTDHKEKRAYYNIIAF